MYLFTEVSVIPFFTTFGSPQTLSNKRVNRRNCTLIINNNTGRGRGVVNWLSEFLKMAAEVDKTLLAFLNGLCRRHFFGEEQFTDDFLRQEILDNMNEEGENLMSLTICRKYIVILCVGFM